MIAAAIDIGTNSTLGLVAEVRQARVCEVLADEERITRLGQQTDHSGLLADPAIQRTTRAVCELVEQAQGLGAARIVITGTSAVRDASNRQQLIDHIKALTGLTVRVLAGDEEARLSFTGALGCGTDDVDQVLLDVGGGSTERIVGQGSRLIEVRSLNIGALRAYEWAGRPQIWPSRFAEIVARIPGLVRTVEELSAAQVPPDARWIGVGGTITTLAALDLGLASWDPQRVHGHCFSLERLREWAERLGATPHRQRSEIPCLQPGRVDLIVPGLCIIACVLQHHQQDRIQTSVRGLRYGAILEP